MLLYFFCHIFGRDSCVQESRINTSSQIFQRLDPCDQWINSCRFDSGPGSGNDRCSVGEKHSHHELSVISRGRHIGPDILYNQCIFWTQIYESNFKGKMSVGWPEMGRGKSAQVLSMPTLPRNAKDNAKNNAKDNARLVGVYQRYL